MNLEDHGEMFLEPSACTDIATSDGCLLVWTMDEGTDERTKWNQYTPLNFVGGGYDNS